MNLKKASPLRAVFNSSAGIPRFFAASLRISRVVSPSLCFSSSFKISSWFGFSTGSAILSPRRRYFGTRISNTVHLFKICRTLLHYIHDMVPASQPCCILSYPLYSKGLQEYNFFHFYTSLAHLPSFPGTLGGVFSLIGVVHFRWGTRHCLSRSNHVFSFDFPSKR